MQSHFTAPHNSTASHLKSRLVDIGADALSSGDSLIVTAITQLIQNRGWAHE
jgi:hypothetical protein